MVIGRAARRAERRARVTAVVGPEAAEAALDILELVELAWHDCYGEVTPPDDVVADILVCSGGDLSRFARAARLAVEDWRDTRVASNAIRHPGR